METTVINIFGGAGIGKSTFAATLFAEMKSRDYNVELIREWVKLWAYEQRKLTYADQVVIFGHQIHEETSFYGKVGCLITDSPLILSGFYEQLNYGTNFMTSIAKQVMVGSRVKYWNIFLKRKWSYQVEGRWQTEAQAKVQDKMMRKFLKDNKLKYDVFDCVEDVMAELLQ